MLQRTLNNTHIYKENKVDNDFWFSFVREKFIHNVDTLYYNVHIQEDWMHDIGVIALKEYLENKKIEALEKMDFVQLDKLGTEYSSHGMGFAKMYAYDIHKTDKYVIFMAKGKPSEDVPPIHVQLRSQYLWLNGEEKAVEQSLNDLRCILELFGLHIKSVVENRIDYAYHTNYVQDPVNFFKLDTLNKMQVSNFERWGMEGTFKNDDDLEVDYVSFGRRTYNNTFFRMYNKTQEVCNKGYKQFFLKVWLLNGLISRYDFYCLEKCFLQGSYEYLDKARLEFYLEHGQDPNIKAEIRDILNNTIKLEANDLFKFANKLVPRVTLVWNFELQCKRKFFSTIVFKEDTSVYDPVTVSLYKLLKNKPILHKYLTQHVIRFVDYKAKNKEGEKILRKRDKPIAPWWRRVQNLQVTERPIVENDVYIVREYQKNVDIKVIRKRMIKSVAVHSLYRDYNNGECFTNDMMDFISSLNENDIIAYNQDKKKKASQLRSKLEDLQNNTYDYDASHNIILNCKTGQIVTID